MRRVLSVVILTVVLTGGFAWVAVAGEKAGSEEHPGHLLVTPDEIEWTEVASLPKGAKVAVIEGDPGKEGPFTMRIKLPAGYTVPRHTHPTVERVTVLEGTFYLGLGEAVDRAKAQKLSEGTLAVMDAGVAMFGYTEDEPVVFQINGDGPWGIDYLDPADDPRKKGE